MNRRQLAVGMICFGLSRQSIEASAQWETWSPPANELPRLAVYRSWWHDRAANVPIKHVWMEAQVYAHEWLARDAFEFYVTPSDESVTSVEFCDVEVSVANIKEKVTPDTVGADETFVRQLLGGGYYLVARKGNLTFIFGFLSPMGTEMDDAVEVVRSILERGKVDFRYTRRNIEELTPSLEDLEHISRAFVLEYEDTYVVQD